MNHKTIFDKLWNEYSNTNQGALSIHRLLEDKGETIVNDHIAFRTFDIPGIDIKALSGLFLKAGYVEKDDYTFEKKRLRAIHMEHSTDKMAPKIFISELITSDFSELVQQTAKKIAEATLSALQNSDDLIYSQTPWEPVSYALYKKLLDESEYAAWLYTWGFRANHFTIFVNHLNSFPDLGSLNIFLKKSGFILNRSGGEIKGSESELLMQSSTLADKVEVDFIEGRKSIPCCYYEFAQRFESEPGKLYNGFIATSADKIFESTDAR